MNQIKEVCDKARAGSTGIIPGYDLPWADLCAHAGNVEANIDSCENCVIKDCRSDEHCLDCPVNPAHVKVF